jgi:hypothetical protein
MLDPTGMMMGVDPASPIRAETCRLSSEHALFMYTDGAVDARNRRGEPVGTERLAAIAATHSHAEPHRAITNIQHEITRFADGADLLDDLTMAWATIHAPQRNELAFTSTSNASGSVSRHTPDDVPAARAAGDMMSPPAGARG